MTSWFFINACEGPSSGYNSHGGVSDGINTSNNWCNIAVISDISILLTIVPFQTFKYS